MTSTEPLSRVKVARREKILDAAERLFAQVGFRATTMEGIACAAGMSKATVYSYFNDKDALFGAVALRLVNRVKAAFREKIRSDGAINQRIADAFIAKYAMCHDVVRSSSYAQELFAQSNCLVAEATLELTNNVEQMVFETLTNEGFSADVARAKARLLMGSILGISDHVTDYGVAVKDIRTLVAAIV